MLHYGFFAFGHERPHCQGQENRIIPAPVLRVRSSGAQGSALLTSVVNANCFIVLEQERGPVAAGEHVTVIPFDSILGYH